MVRLRVAGGRLIQEKLEEAARLHAKGNGSAAVELYREILRESPRHPDALHMMGIIAQQGNNPELALKFFELALAAQPDYTSAWYNRGLTLYALKRESEALESIQAALQLDPLLAEAWNLKGLILKNKRDYPKARECHERAIALQPNAPSFHDNFASLLMAMDNFPDAYLAARQANIVAPDHASTTLCAVLNCMGYPEKVLEHFAFVRSRLPPTLVGEATVTEAMTFLQIGDFDEGWKLWEQRTLFPCILDDIPLWRGEKTPRLYLYEDQGMGDAIQFLRYVPLLKEWADKIVLCLREPLKTLAAENFPDLEIVGEGDILPRVSKDSTRYRLASLSHFFSTRLDNIPSPPYLAADMKRRALWRGRLSNISAPRVGLVWAGGKLFKNDSARSLSFSTLHPLVSCGAKHFVSLQKERPEDKTPEIFDAAPYLHDFAETAALISELDLVITVDTAVAHLAGALGKPVWILLPFSSDWRWLIGREDSPWYPSARLFRQTKPGDWARVVGQVKSTLDRFILRGLQGFAAGNMARGMLAPKSPCATIAVMNGNVESHKEKAIALFAQGDFAAAEIYCRSAVIAAPEDASTHYNLGVVLAKRGNFEEAIASYRQTIVLTPTFAPAYTNIGFCLNAYNLIARAREAFAIARSLDPDNPVPVLNEGIAALALGDYTTGWRDFAARWRLPAYAKFKRDFDKPLWNGENLSGKKLFIYSEQGFGDTIQMARFIPLLAAQGGTIMVEVQPALAALFRSVRGAAQIIVQGETLPEFDTYCAMMDIPRILGTVLETIPTDTPYIFADGAQMEFYRTLSPRKAGRRVGLCWAGRASHENDHNRSLKFSEIAPLLDCEGIEWVNLQRLIPPDDAASFAASTVLDRGQNFADFSATAAAMMNCDLIITVDTAVAHLAGALGKEVWIFLPFYADWRWLIERKDSPWYPTARLFRQKERGDWEEIIAGARSELRATTCNS